MDRHPRRHGQAVGYGSRLRPGFVLLLVACLAFALAAVRWGLAGRHGDTEPDVGRVEASSGADIGDAGASGDEAAAGGASVSDNGNGAPDAALGGEGPSGSSGNRPSRDGAFLDALARDAARSDRSHDGVAARQTWTEDRSLPEAAADVLRAYADEPCASLAMGGYLDIKGDVWGAIIRDARGWVDMVSCTAGENDASCNVSVVRLMPKTQGRSGSEGS